MLLLMQVWMLTWQNNSLKAWQGGFAACRVREANGKVLRAAWLRNCATGLTTKRKARSSYLARQPRPTKIRKADAPGQRRSGRLSNGRPILFGKSLTRGLGRERIPGREGS